ncbi:MAG: hypothetical protein Q4G25_01620 [Paracoccus sp. (in: a-proteobacteria)]|nr:hypothetical protein [Paracoccus sp. (in: a-proteobacteria)]
MSTTVTDQNPPGRVSAFLTQERRAGIHPAITILHRRPHERETSDSRKIREYARIERGRQT